VVANNGADAVANARHVTSYEPGMCLKYVRGEAWEVGSLYGSAIEAWNGSTDKHPGDRNPPLGAPCFYDGGQYGHVVVFVGGDMRSTDCQTTGRVSETDLDWPSRTWGSAYRYLGWCGDLNGVDLPLDNSTEGDDVPTYDHASTKQTTNLKAGQWRAITWQAVTGAGNFIAGTEGLRIGGHRFSSVLHVVVDAPTGSTIRTRTVEYDPNAGVVKETNPGAEFIATSGSSSTVHPQIGAAAEGRRVQFQVMCTDAATLIDADAAVLSW
jgi:hypothetical protein